MSDKPYIISSKDGYWNNEFGWGDYNDATEFESPEYNNLPIGDNVKWTKKKKIYGWTSFDPNRTRPFQVFEELNAIFCGSEVEETAKITGSLRFVDVSSSVSPTNFNETAVVIGEADLTEEEAKDYIEFIYRDLYGDDDK